MTELRVLIIADDPLAGRALTMALGEREDCEVAGQESAESDLLLAVELHRPDVILWDLGWQGGTGIEALIDKLSSLVDDLPPIVALLPQADDSSSLAWQAWIAGARGLLPRTAPSEAVMAALAATLTGLVVIDPELTAGLLTAPDLTSPTLAESLTERELQVLALVAEGLPNKGIARELDISEHTVKFHLNAIMGKLDAQSRTEAVVKATRLGLIML
ncbi:MAG: response regulator transcription factor [Caldilineales bacterium]|nr:response regulator transcription factor [Caldilineales bacterium]